MAPGRTRLLVPAAFVALLVIVAAMRHQDESQRLRLEHQQRVIELQQDLKLAYECALALLDSAVAPPRISAEGDTLIYRLPGTGSSGPKDLRLFVDHTRGGLWMTESGARPMEVAAAVDGFRASIETVQGAQTSVWVEIQARLDQTGNLPVRSHVFRSLPPWRTDGTG